MAIHLGLDSEADLNEWMNSKLFAPMWREYDEGYFAQFRDNNTIQPKGAELRQVLASIMEGERQGARRYSADPLDTGDYKAIDWVARFLYTASRRLR